MIKKVKIIMIVSGILLTLVIAIAVKFTISDKTDTCRIMAPSRFGYPGSDVPKDPSVDNQVQAYMQLLTFI